MKAQWKEAYSTVQLHINALMCMRRNPNPVHSAVVLKLVEHELGYRVIFLGNLVAKLFAFAKEI